MIEYILCVKYETSLDVLVFADSKSEARTKARQGKHHGVVENIIGKPISCGPAFEVDRDSEYI